MDDTETVTEIINSTYKLFTADNIYISVYFGVGTLITDLSDLKQSLSQCFQHLHSAISDDRKNSTKSTTIFGHKENVQLNSYLINANTSAALELLDSINSQLLNLPRAIIKNVYSDILFSIYRVMNSKGISPTQNINDDISYISEICSESQNDIYEHAVQCIETIGAMHNTSVKKISIEDVVEYICNHFNEDLSLDLLAERYGTYPQYLSKRLKQHLGLTFHDYISSLRVEKAKELLTTTDKGITRISEESGFVSRNTFLRVFKKYTGVPPSEYRQHNSDK